MQHIEIISECRRRPTVAQCRLERFNTVFGLALAHGIIEVYAPTTHWEDPPRPLVPQGQIYLGVYLDNAVAETPIGVVVQGRLL